MKFQLKSNSSFLYCWVFWHTKRPKIKSTPCFWKAACRKKVSCDWENGRYTWHVPAASLSLLGFPSSWTQCFQGGYSLAMYRCYVSATPNRKKMFIKFLPQEKYLLLKCDLKAVRGRTWGRAGASGPHGFKCCAYCLPGQWMQQLKRHGAGNWGWGCWLGPVFPCLWL